MVKYPSEVPAKSDMLEELGDREVAVCRELTKLHEEVFRGSLSEAVEHFQAPLGELVLVVRGAPEEPLPAGPPPSQLEEARRELSRLREAGTRAKEAVAQVAVSLDMPKNTVYQLWLETTRSDRG